MARPFKFDSPHYLPKRNTPQVGLDHTVADRQVAELRFAEPQPTVS